MPQDRRSTQPRRRLTALRVIVVAELVVALVTGATVVFAYEHVDQQIDTGAPIEHIQPRKQAPLPTGEMNILLMGTDSRACAGCDIDNQAGEGGSDTTILLHIADGRRSAYGISIPRDALVDRPTCRTPDGGTAPAASDVQWNVAYTVGGAACTARQVEAVTGITVDSYIAVNFGGFKDMVDAINGVEVCIPKPVDDTVAHIHFDAGTQTLDGDRALQYVRERHSTANSDLGRMKRQQAFIASMIGKVMGAGTLTRPDRLYHFASSLADSLEASPDLASAGKLVKLAASLRHADLGHIKFVSAPTTDFPVDDPNWGRLQFTPEAQVLWDRVKNDEPLGRFGKGAVSGKNPNGGKDSAAENGLCA
ncbi:LCP family protein [Nocardioides aquiterrae]|uniref:LCP family protein n=1 Tax=Nocardioides aquiterrae TaxID=203799 RepID=A0ABP4FA36_9ACTN